MANRLKPFQNIDEKDVLVMYAMESANVNETIGSSGDGDIGVIVEITQAELGKLPVQPVDNPAVGITKGPHQKVMYNSYESPWKVKPATGAVSPLGVTLLQTAKQDNNGDNLVNKSRAFSDINMCVPVGESTKIVSAGILTFTTDAFDVADPTAPGIAVNDKLAVSSAAPGKWVKAGASDVVYGKVIATGREKNAKNSGKANLFTYVVQFNFNK